METDRIAVTEAEAETLVNGENKSSRTSANATDDDRTPNVSPIRKITIRQSNDSEIAEQASYEIIERKKRRDSRSKNSPPRNFGRHGIYLGIHRSPSPEEKALDNGLDPIGIELISSNASMNDGTEYCETENTDELESPKMNREMKNLQKSANNSKILSNYLSTPTESPRRSRKNKDIPIVDPDEHFEVETGLKEFPESTAIDMEVESDGLALPMEPPEKRRKSISRSRSRIRSASSNRGRKKSIARQMKDELSTSDKEEEVAEDEDENMSDISFVTNRSIDGRAINPPPKVNMDFDLFRK